MNINSLFIPQSLISKTLNSLDFHSKLKCERVCKVWNQCLYIINGYQEKKEEYFAHRFFPGIKNWPTDLINVFGKRIVSRMPVYRVLSCASPKEMTHCLLRSKSIFCRGEQWSKGQSIAIAYHTLTRDNPRIYYNAVIICRERVMKKACSPLSNDNWSIDFCEEVKSFKDIKTLIVNGSIQGSNEGGVEGRTIILGFKKNSTEVFFEETKIAYHFVSTKIATFFGRIFAKI